MIAARLLGVLASRACEDSPIAFLYIVLWVVGCWGAAASAGVLAYRALRRIYDTTAGWTNVTAGIIGVVAFIAAFALIPRLFPTDPASWCLPLGD